MLIACDDVHDDNDDDYDDDDDNDNNSNNNNNIIYEFVIISPSNAKFKLTNIKGCPPVYARHPFFIR